MVDVEAGKSAPPGSTSPMSTKDVVDMGRRHSFYISRYGTDRFNLVALHRMNMHYLRSRMLNEAAVVFGNGVMTDEDSNRLTALMRDYCIAVRDREFMRDWAQRDWDGNPFFLKSEGGELEQALLSSLRAKGIRPDRAIPLDQDAHIPLFPGGPWDMDSALKLRRQRYTGAIVGGVILTVPMILMVLLRSTTANLVIASVSTMIFALGATYLSPTKVPVELLGVTAAYAAVLVVFVGGTTVGAPG